MYIFDENIMSIVFLLEVGFGFSLNFVSYGCGFFYIEFHKVLEMWTSGDMDEGLLVTWGFTSFREASLFLSILWHHLSSFSILLISLTRLVSFFLNLNILNQHLCAVQTCELAVPLSGTHFPTNVQLLALCSRITFLAGLAWTCIKISMHTPPFLFSFHLLPFSL